MGIISELGESATKGVFEGIGSLAKSLRTAITGIDPEKQAEIEEKLLALEAASDEAQTQVNAIEAQSPSLFKSGWRPAAAWTCIIGMFYQFIAFPFLTWASLNFGWKTPPVLDTNVLMSMLFGLLGLGTHRMFEKKWEVASK